jgi:hypothetical protein
MLRCRIIGRPLDWAEGSLPGYAALKLPLYFLRAALLKRISATARHQRPCDHEQDRHAFHLLILESGGGIARVRSLKHQRVMVEPQRHCHSERSEKSLNTSSDAGNVTITDISLRLT